jgi:hypothetical protein
MSLHRKNTLLALTLVWAATFPSFGKSQDSKTLAGKTPAWKVVQNKDCGFSLRYPKGSRLEKPSDCVLEITLPPTPGAKWIQEATLTLEVMESESQESGDNPENWDEPERFILAGGLKFSKAVEEDDAAGHRYITVSYTALGKHHRYQFTGVLKAVNPELFDESVPHWNPQKSAEKIFDGVLLGFRPLERF